MGGCRGYCAPCMPRFRSQPLCVHHTIASPSPPSPSLSSSVSEEYIGGNGVGGVLAGRDEGIGVRMEAGRQGDRLPPFLSRSLAEKCLLVFFLFLLAGPLFSSSSSPFFAVSIAFNGGGYARTGGGGINGDGPLASSRLHTWWLKTIFILCFLSFLLPPASRNLQWLVFAHPSPSLAIVWYGMGWYGMGWEWEWDWPLFYQFIPYVERYDDFTRYLPAGTPVSFSPSAVSTPSYQPWGDIVGRDLGNFSRPILCR